MRLPVALVVTVLAVAFATSATAQPMGPPPNPALTREACSRLPSIVPGQVVQGSTIGQADRFRASCAGGGASPDTAFGLVLQQAAHVSVQVTANYDSAITIRSQ